jgi:zinc protease
MKTGRLRAVIIALALAFAPVVAVSEPVKAIVFPHEKSERKPDPAARYGRLPNGLTYVIQANGTPKGTAAIYMRVAAGSLVETEAQKGLAHFVEHMAFNGTTNIPEGELRRRLERHGFAFGADTNAFTFDTKTLYMLNAPKSDDGTLDEALFILREMAGNVRLDPAAINRERGVILSEERLRANPASRRAEAWNRRVHAGARYAEFYDPIGSTDIIRTAPPEQLKAFYDAWYRPELTTIIAVGDFDAVKVEAMIQAKFSDWQGRDPMPDDPDWGARTPSGPQTFAFEEKGLAEEMGISWIAPEDTRDDTPARMDDYFLDNYLFQIVNTRLSERALAADSAFFQASMGAYPVPHTARVTFLSVLPKPGRAREALTQAYGVVHTLRAEGVTKTELNKAQQTVESNFRFLQGVSATRDSAGLAATIVAGLDQNTVAEGPEDSVKLYKAYKGKVGRKDLMDARLRAWFTGDGPILSHSGESLGDYDESAMRADYEALSNGEAAAYAASRTKAWPYGRLFTPKVSPVSQTRDTDYDFNRYVWPNGITLHIKPTKLVANQIRVQVDFAGGQLLFDPKTRPPLFLASGDFLYQGGLNKLTMTQLSDVLRTTQVGVGYTLGADQATLSGTTNPSSLSHQVETLYAYATDAAYRSDPYDRYLAWLPEYLRTLKAAPESVRVHNWGRILHNGDPRFDETRLNRIEEIRFDDIRDILRRSLTDTPIHITIVGDVDERKAVTEIGKTFGTLAPRPARPAEAEGARQVLFPPKDRDITLHHEGRTDGAMSIALWPTDDFMVDPKAARVATLLATVLSNRLQDELRETQGADYAPYAFAYNDETYAHLGMVGVVSAVKAGADGDFRTALSGIVADLKAKPVSDDELDRARKPVLAAMDNETSDIGYWTYVLARLGTRPDLRADWLGRRKHYEEMTPEDLMALARRYLKEDTVVAVRIVPKV